MIKTAMNGCYFLAIALAVVPLGAVRPLPLGIATAFFWIVCLASAFAVDQPRHSRRLFAAALMVLAACGLWVLLQSLDLPFAALQAPVWHDLGTLLGIEKGAISAEPADSLHTLMFLALPMAAFLSGLKLNIKDEDGKAIITALTILGSVCAVFGLVQFLLFPTTLLIFEKGAYKDSLTSVFVNRNTAGTFLGLTSLLLIHQIWALWVDRTKRPRPQSSHSGKTPQPSMAYVVVFCLLLASTVIALFLTKSRAAVASTAITWLFFTVALLRESRIPRREGAGAAITSRLQAILRFGSVGVVILVIAGLLGGQLLQRAQIKGGEDGRFCVMPGLWEAIRDRWLSGYGFGTFRYAFPPYRDPACGLGGIWERAHNFYLEGWLGLGLVFFAFLLFSIAVLVRVHLRGLKVRKSVRSYSLLGLACMLLVALHAVVDFSLEIPGMATFTAAILAATSSISLGRAGQRSGKKT